MTKLEIIEATTKELFIESVEAFVGKPNCWILSVKFQRNLFYKGIGSSAGRTPGSDKNINDSKLEESYVAFILWNDTPESLTENIDTRFRD